MSNFDDAHPLTLAYLGPPGSHSHQAAVQLTQRLGLCTGDLSDSSLSSHPSFGNILSMLDAAALSWAVLPVENLLEGSVSEVLMALGLNRYPGVRSWAEFSIPVTHALLGRVDTIPADITAVYSHPQALAQCRETLFRQYGESLAFHGTASTSQAAKKLANGELPAGAAVIASPLAAERYGLSMLSEVISDVPDNVTRFWLLGGPTAPDIEPVLQGLPQKTSFCLAFPDRPGGLVDVLLLFKAADINLSKIESRPSRKRLGEYIFYIDAEGDVSAQKDLLASLAGLTSRCHLIGPYACLGLLSPDKPE